MKERDEGKGVGRGGKGMKGRGRSVEGGRRRGRGENRLLIM